MALAIELNVHAMVLKAHKTRAGSIDERAGGQAMQIFSMLQEIIEIA